MARRRMVDTSIWEDEHFGSLSDKAKILFIACITNADDEGILSGNINHLKAIAFRYDEKITNDKVVECLNECRTKLHHFKQYAVNNCDYIWLEKWGTYQQIRTDRFKPTRYPKFDNSNQMSTKCQPLVVADEVKLNQVKLNQVKTDKGIVKGGSLPSVNQEATKKTQIETNSEQITENPLFEKIWQAYPNKDGRKEALRHFTASVKTDRDFADIARALLNYKRSEKVAKGFIKDGSTWFNNWRDWINPTPEMISRNQPMNGGLVLNYEKPEIADSVIMGYKQLIDKKPDDREWDKTQKPELRGIALELGHCYDDKWDKPIKDAMNKCYNYFTKNNLMWNLNTILKWCKSGDVNKIRGDNFNG